MPDLGDLADRIDALAARAAEGERSADLSRAMEDLLCDGYAACLKIDSRIRRVDRRRQELIAVGLDADRHDGLRDLEDRRECLEGTAADTRRMLGALRERFIGLGGLQAARR